MKKLFILVVIIVLYYSYTFLMQDYSRESANNLIEKIEIYKKDTGKYPDSLNNLIPKYISKLPKNKSSIDNKFHYISLEGGKNYSFYYTYFAPFSKYSYNNKKKIWISLD